MFAGHNPWYLMEHSTSAVQWKPVNTRKRNGEMVRDALAHVAMGADAVNFFQWRQSRSGAEAFHSAMVPHAGPDTTVFREVCDLGVILKRLSDSGVQGTCPVMRRPRSCSPPAPNGPRAAARSPAASSAIGMISATGIARSSTRDPALDVVPLSADWSGYGTVILPTVLVLSDEDTARLAAFAEDGGRVVVDYATGIVDDNFRTGLGGYPGAGDGLLRRMLGVRGEEFNILGPIDGEPDAVRLSNGAVSRLWQTVVTSVAADTEIVASYHGADASEWQIDGVPAVTRHPYGKGEAWYVGCDLDRADIAHLLRFELARSHACTDPTHRHDPRILHVARVGEGGRFDCISTGPRNRWRCRVGGEVVVLFRGDDVPRRLRAAAQRRGAGALLTVPPAEGTLTASLNR